MLPAMTDNAPVPDWLRVKREQSVSSPTYGANLMRCPDRVACGDYRLFRRRRLRDRRARIPRHRCRETQGDPVQRGDASRPAAWPGILERKALATLGNRSTGRPGQHVLHFGIHREVRGFGQQTAFARPALPNGGRRNRTCPRRIVSVREGMEARATAHLRGSA